MLLTLLLPYCHRVPNRKLNATAGQGGKIETVDYKWWAKGLGRMADYVSGQREADYGSLVHDEANHFIRRMVSKALINAYTDAKNTSARPPAQIPNRPKRKNTENASEHMCNGRKYRGRLQNTQTMPPTRLSLLLFGGKISPQTLSVNFHINLQPLVQAKVAMKARLEKRGKSTCLLPCVYAYSERHHLGGVGNLCKIYPKNKTCF